MFNIDDDATVRPWPPENPFSTGTSLPLSPVGGVSTRLLVQTVLAGTAEDDGIPDHAHDLFADLTERGRTAWHEAGMLLVQYVLSGGSFSTGFDAAGSYLGALPDALPQSLEIAHFTIAAWMHVGKDGAANILAVVEDERLHQAVRWLLCLAVACSGVSTEARDRFLTAVAPNSEA